MAVDVSAFTAMARAEFQNGLIERQGRVKPAKYDAFTTELGSSVRVETHLFMSNLPRLREFKGHNPEYRLASSPYTITNKEWRVGPVTVRKTDLDDDQVGGYLMTIKGIPKRAESDIGFKILDHLAAGTTNLCFDGTAYFADSHTFGSGDNLMTTDNSGNDALTHKIVALIPTSDIKPVIFQNREPVKELRDDYTPQAMLTKEFHYWADTRFGLGYGYWFDAIHVTITDTPTLTELDTQLTEIANRFRTFTLPKGSDVDDSLYVHEGWVPESENFYLLCNLGLAQLLYKLRTTELIAAGSGGAVINNQWREKFTLVPTSALGA